MSHRGELKRINFILRNRHQTLGLFKKMCITIAFKRIFIESNLLHINIVTTSAAINVFSMIGQEHFHKNRTGIVVATAPDPNNHHLKGLQSLKPQISSENLHCIPARIGYLQFTFPADAKSLLWSRIATNALKSRSEKGRKRPHPFLRKFYRLRSKSHMYEYFVFMLIESLSFASSTGVSSSATLQFLKHEWKKKSRRKSTEFFNIECNRSGGYGAHCNLERVFCVRTGTTRWALQYLL